ncbi:hypothetical protein [Corynebacterium kalinowskii]|uniref:hypothetical protein n=1 Tax=Corynebacterium kalinowskii TaxID=2675216 RepID=UPI0012E0F708|nr:hypothetical protein [Corynebacterium kalinowskii]
MDPKAPELITASAASSVITPMLTQISAGMEAQMQEKVFEAARDGAPATSLPATLRQ